MPSVNATPISPRPPLSAPLLRRSQQASAALNARAHAALRLMFTSGVALCVSSLLSVLMGSTLGVSAQVNIERERLSAPQEGLKLSLDGSLALIRGNVSLSQVGLGGKLSWVKGRHQPFVQASLAYGERDEVSFLDQSFYHARWTAMWREHLGSEVFAQLQQDAFRSLVLRQLYGGGARARLASWEGGSLALGVGYMLEREAYRDEGLTRVELNHRSTNYLALSHTFKAKTEVTLANSLYIQPKIGELSDYRALNDLSLEIKLSDTLRLVEALSTLYDSAPPPNVKRVDLKSSTTLRLVF